MKRFNLEVEHVTGHCTYGYKKGDVLACEGYDTPDRFCGGAHTAPFPIIVALQSGARVDFEQNPLSKTGMACPDNGHVIFTVTVAE